MIVNKIIFNYKILSGFNNIIVSVTKPKDLSLNNNIFYTEHHEAKNN